MILYLRRTGTFEIGFLPVGFHEIRIALALLAAINSESGLQVKVLDNTFNILNFRSMDPG